jgi:hypothetical protein
MPCTAEIVEVAVRLLTVMFDPEAVTTLTKPP